MRREDDQRVRSFGTRVRLFPQAPYLAGFGEPEVVWLSPQAGTVRPGPADDRIYVVDAIDKAQPYAFPNLPPFIGNANPPVAPSKDGHFDHLPTDSRAFICVHAYGSLRRVLDIFESYYGRRIDWHFQSHYERLEVIPLIDWQNAQSGYGFMEFGLTTGEQRVDQPFALNFDVIAHELGHSILFSALDLPADGTWTPQFSAFHESMADLVSLLSLMHFDTVLDRLLHASHGNIYTLNELNRIGELSETRQIRIAGSSRKMSEVTDEVHDRSRPLTGAFFDVLVYFYLEALYDRGLVDRAVRDASQIGLYHGQLQPAFDKAYARRHFEFKAALSEARDMLGTRLAATTDALSPNYLGFSDVLTAFLAVDRSRSGMRYQDEIREIFRWREIDEYPTYPRL